MIQQLNLMEEVVELKTIFIDPMIYEQYNGLHTVDIINLIPFLQNILQCSYYLKYLFCF